MIRPREGRNHDKTRWRAGQSAAQLVGVEDFFVDVGPELFEGEVGGVDEVAGEPLLADFGPGAVFGGVVEGGDSGCCARSDDLGEVEHLVAVVLAGDEDTGGGVEHAFAETTMAESVEAVVLMEDDGAEAADPEVFVGGVGEGVPVVAAVADGALMKLRVRFAVHGEACLNSRDEEGGVVEAVLPGEDELFFGGLGRELCIAETALKLGMMPRMRLVCWVPSVLTASGSVAVWVPGFLSGC